MRKYKNCHDSNTFGAQDHSMLYKTIVVFFIMNAKIFWASKQCVYDKGNVFISFCTSNDLSAEGI